MSEVMAQALEAVRERVRRNLPRSHNPDAFHEEKSEITGELTKLARAARSGRDPE